MLRRVPDGERCPLNHRVRSEAGEVQVLLAGDHEPWSRAELQRELSGSTGDPVDPSDAINALYASGLVHVAGDLVFPSRAACLMDELQL